jgi:hypothetical protein
MDEVGVEEASHGVGRELRATVGLNLDGDAVLVEVRYEAGDDLSGGWCAT